MPTMINDPDSLKWGRLVKSWSTGLDYVHTEAANQTAAVLQVAAGRLEAAGTGPGHFQHGLVPGNYPGRGSGSPPPRSSALCKVAKIDAVNYPPKTAEVIIVQGDETTMVIRLPPTAVLQESEQNLLKGGAYPTPSFYEPCSQTRTAVPIPSANPPTTAQQSWDHGPACQSHWRLHDGTLRLSRQRITSRDASCRHRGCRQR